MILRRVAILSIGEMGYHWSQLLTRHGIEVLTYSKGRSEVTRKRAENAGVRSVPSMARLVSEADLIVSIVVPLAAKRLAAKVAAALAKVGRAEYLYLDANAISPMTAAEIGNAAFQGSPGFVDGCIIGSATKLDKGATIYVSGPRADEIKALESCGFAIRVLGTEIGQASAFKIVYAGLTKGLQGLLVELLVGARNFGLLREILQRYEESFPGLVDKVASSIVALPVHAGRRAEEMIELAQTFRSHGLRPIMAPATQKLLKAIAELNTAHPSETGRREGDLLDVLEQFFQKGLMRVPA
ncbi:MAG: NAD(P)-dependent oxidoreductase [Deltaproteobacteria bacterium]|nr:NAD(P)-dependent oxidoreductase [Deltaproteobacteria bacterium]